MQNNSNKPVIMFILTFVFAVSAGAWFSFEASFVKPENQVKGTVLTEAKMIDGFSLTDNKQRAFTLENLKDRWSILFFGYTHCPDICPTTLSTLKQMHLLLSEQQADSLQVVFVSVDHERDHPELLDGYLSYFNNDFVGLSGDLVVIEKLAQNLGIYFKKAASSSSDPTSDYLIDHATTLIMVNPEAKLKAVLSGPYNAVSLYNDVLTLIRR